MIGDCKIACLDEIYKIEESGAEPITLADGLFRSMKLFTCNDFSKPFVYSADKFKSSNCFDLFFTFVPPPPSPTFHYFSREEWS